MTRYGSTIYKLCVNYQWNILWNTESTAFSDQHYIQKIYKNPSKYIFSGSIGNGNEKCIYCFFFLLNFASLFGESIYNILYIYREGLYIIRELNNMCQIIYP